MKSIDRNQYLQLLGLLTLAQRHTRALDDIEAALREITDDAEGAHTSDLIYGFPISASRNLEYQIAEYLKRLEITVEGAAEVESVEA